MQTLIIDGRDLYGKKELHDYIAKALDFPSYYGANLDALNDMLTSRKEITNIYLLNLDILADHIGSDYTKKFVKLLMDIEEKNAFLTILR
ncbi:barstar family protein [Aerococcus urinaeequi]|uniref:Ribonuclease barnase inhibitor barstar n=1 Tax=Aerococcus viridans TaxID=1377 RepID=A0A2N6UGH3_9LACT|nr:MULTISPECIES: barstar family protein [Aerococcus]OFU53432.1 ribonuclease barnase inhibitor barstar [Aerococcus sp. HMSC10H05]PMC80711.1 ribonuclease barnase inhibitor barstar [Aerococcus viridans]